MVDRDLVTSNDQTDSTSATSNSCAHMIIKTPSKKQENVALGTCGRYIHQIPFAQQYYPKVTIPYMFSSSTVSHPFSSTRESCLLKLSLSTSHYKDEEANGSVFYLIQGQLGYASHNERQVQSAFLLFVLQPRWLKRPSKRDNGHVKWSE